MISNGQSFEKLISWIKVDLFAYELIVLPVNQTNHWYLFVADLVRCNYFIYDPLTDYGNHISDRERIM